MMKERSLSWEQSWWILTGSLSWGLGVEDGQRVVGVQVRFQEGHGHGTHQGGKTLPKRWQMSAKVTYNYYNPFNIHVNKFNCGTIERYNGREKSGEQFSMKRTSGVK